MKLTTQRKKLNRKIGTRDDVEYTIFDINIAMFDVADLVILDVDFIWLLPLETRQFLDEFD